MWIYLKKKKKHFEHITIEYAPLYIFKDELFNKTKLHLYFVKNAEINENNVQLCYNKCALVIIYHSSLCLKK